MNFQPDYKRLREINEYHALIVTAANSNNGYVLRYFAQKLAYLKIWQQAQHNALLHRIGLKNLVQTH
ncbi:hypothetical protein LFREDSHE_24950 [Shewanella baltica]